MPIFEYICPVHGKIERYFPESKPTITCYRGNDPILAQEKPCMLPCKLVEFSVPAKRDPDKGIQR